jgi:hypothetical protein
MESDMTTATVNMKFNRPTSRKDAYDLNHVKSVSAIVVLYNGKYAGRIVANWSDNPNGSVCTATVSIWLGPLEPMPKCTGRAGGYGYDKISSAISDAINKVIDEDPDKIAPRFSGCGMTEVRKWFEQFGYELFEII